MGGRRMQCRAVDRRGGIWRPLGAEDASGGNGADLGWRLPGPGASNPIHGGLLLRALRGTLAATAPAGPNQREPSPGVVPGAVQFRLRVFGSADARVLRPFLRPMGGAVFTASLAA